MTFPFVKVLKLTDFLDSKVNDGGLGGNFWCVVRVAQLCCDVKPEVVVVLHFLVAQSNQVNTTCQMNSKECEVTSIDTFDIKQAPESFMHAVLIYRIPLLQIYSIT